MYAIETKNGAALHYAEGSASDVQSFDPVLTMCGRTLKPLNVFLSLEDYVSSYNCNGHACPLCAKVYKHKQA